MKRFLPSILALAALLGGSPLPAAEAPAAYWPLDDELSDASGNGHLLIDPYKKLTYVPGVAGKAAAFDAERKNYIRLPAASPLAFEGDFTVAGWVKIPAPSGSVAYGIFKRWEYGGGAQFDVEYEGNRIVATLSTDGNNLIRLTSLAPLVPDEWSQVALAYDSKTRTARLWLTPQSEKAIDLPVEKHLDAPLFHPAKAEFVIGLGLGSHFLVGAVDEVVVFERALAATEIAALFASGQKGKPAVGR